MTIAKLKTVKLEIEVTYFENSYSEDRLIEILKNNDIILYDVSTTGTVAYLDSVKKVA